LKEYAVKQTIFINKFNRIREKIAECIPEGAAVQVLDGKCVLVALPESANRKAVVTACRERLGTEQASLVQSVISCREHGDSLEVALPGMTRFFQRTA
jgi:hypothetical protein